VPESPFAAEGLHADDGADEVAVHVGVADVQAVGDALDGFVDAAVDAQRQAVAGIGDGHADLVELVGTPADDVQDRTEDFPQRRAILSIS
jgi:putative hemolysin